MANKQCSINVLGDDLLNKLRRAGILEDIESKIDDAVKKFEGDSLDTAKLTEIRNGVITNEVNKMKKQLKPKVVETKNSITMVEKLEDKVDWFVTNFPKNPLVKNFKKGDKDKLLNNLLIGVLYESNYSKGAILEENTSSTFGAFWGNLIDRRLTKEVGDDWFKFTRGRENSEKIVEDLRAIQLDPTRKTSVSNSNTPHYKIARAIADSFEKMVAENNLVGGKMTMLNLLPKVRLNVNKIKNKKDEFINDFAEFLDDQDIIQKYGITDPAKIKATKREIAIKEYDRVTSASPDMDTFGNELDMTINRDYQIASSGKSYFDITAKYTSEQDIESVFFEQFQKLSEQHAMTKMFGASPLTFIDKLKKQLSKSEVWASAANGKGMDILQRGLTAKIERRPIARGYFMSALQNLRNVTLGKLGFVFVDQMIIEPVFSAFRLFFRGDNTMKNMLGNMSPFQGKKKRNVARFHNVAMEGFTGAINNRYFGEAFETGGTVTDFTRNMANKFMRITGSTLLSDGQASAGFNVQRLDITDALKSGKKWKQLKADKKRRRFILDLEQAGIDEGAWDDAVRQLDKYLDEDGLFDPFAIPVINNTLRSRGQTRYDAWMAYFQKRVDGLSRMKPGEIDNARLTFYNDGKEMNAVVKTLVQFKSFAFQMGRRVYGDAYLHGGYVGVMKQTAGLAIPMFAAGVIATQAREIMKGNAPLSFDFTEDSTLLERAYQRSGITAMFAPLFDPLITEQISAIYNDSANKRNLQNDYEREILGPSISSMINVLSGASSTVSSVFTEKEDFKKNAFGFTRDLGAMFLPNGLGFSKLQKYLLYDVLEQNLLPKEYKKRKRREKKLAIKQRDKKATNILEWADRIN